VYRRHCSTSKLHLSTFEQELSSKKGDRSTSKPHHSTSEHEASTFEQELSSKKGDRLIFYPGNCGFYPRNCSFYPRNCGFYPGDCGFYPHDSSSELGSWSFEHQLSSSKRKGLSHYKHCFVCFENSSIAMASPNKDAVRSLLYANAKGAQNYSGFQKA
jgi:hypothetical protein